ncbi:hypothetical protein RB628_18620 [Streptomyces sp. ADMS]|nr:hypothetical protein [Streptomyces sp. ADMS]MDW4907310.1 hypothetical protein [Streptomyces sp. ADMS]
MIERRQCGIGQPVFRQAFGVGEVALHVDHDQRGPAAGSGEVGELSVAQG